jgi:transglutaminase-like putative cysteine protease
LNYQFFKNPHLYIPAIGCLFLVALEFPWWYGGLNFIFLLWRFLGEKNKIALPPRWLSNILAGAVFILVLATYGTVFDKESAPLFFSCLCSLKILEYRHNRDHLFIVLLLMFLLATKFLFSIDIWLAPVSVWFLYHLFRSLLPASNGPQLSFRYYFLKVIMLALPVTVFLYILFPRINSTLIKSSLSKSTGLSGFGAEIKPGSISELVLSKELVFHAEVLKNRYLEYHDLYWRGLTLKINDGFRWMQGHVSEDFQLPDDKELISYKITMEPNRQRWAFTLEYPISLSAGTFPVLRNREGGFSTALPIENRMVFRGESNLFTKTRPKNLSESLQLSNISPEIKALANSIKGKSTSRNEIVQKILNYFGNNNFYYTLTPGEMNSQSPDDFLFRVKKGFCEHYSSAFAILARAAGVPARVVIGYQGGEYNQLGNFYVITSQDAHAWNEYVDDNGYWRRADVVDVVAPLRTQVGATDFLNLPEDMRSFRIKEHLTDEPFLIALNKTVGLYLSSLNFYWTQWLLDFNFDRQAELLQHLPVPFIILLFIFTAGTFVLFLIHRLWGFWSEQKNLVTIIYRSLLNWALAHGLPKESFEGPQSFLVRLQSVWPHHSESFEFIVRKYIEFTYMEKSLNYEELYTMASKLQKIEKSLNQRRYLRGNSLE